MPKGRYVSNIVLLAGKEEKSRRAPWEFGRFLKTANFYGAFKPKISFLSNLFKKKVLKEKVINPSEEIWSVVSNPFSIRWGPLDDVVMGGVSKSNLGPGDTFNGTWTGIVTTANNGGFAGIRTRPFDSVLDISKCEGLILSITGDGQRYKLIVRDNDEFNGKNIQKL